MIARILLGTASALVVVIVGVAWLLDIGGRS